MKKLLTMVMVVIMGIASMQARDRVTTDINTLPSAAKTMINKYYGKTGVNHIKIDSKVLGGNEYDVILNNGVELEFDSKGVLKEIDCGHESVPDGILLKPIRDYVSRNFKGRKIVKMDVKRNSYEVELSDDIELVFDRAGNFKRIDD